MSITISYTDAFPFLRNRFEDYISCSTAKLLFTTADTQELLKELGWAVQLPDICIVRFQYPIPGYSDFISEIKQRWPSIKVLVICSFKIRGFIVEALYNDLDGFLTALYEGSEICKAIKAIGSGGVYFRDKRIKALYDEVKHKRIEKLVFTPMELTIWAHRYCKDYQELAWRLNISESAAKEQCESLFEKIGLSKMESLHDYNSFIDLSFHYPMR